MRARGSSGPHIRSDRVRPAEATRQHVPRWRRRWSGSPQGATRPRPSIGHTPIGIIADDARPPTDCPRARRRMMVSRLVCPRRFVRRSVPPILRHSVILRHPPASGGSCWLTSALDDDALSTFPPDSRHYLRTGLANTSDSVASPAARAADVSYPVRPPVNGLPIRRYSASSVGTSTTSGCSITSSACRSSCAMSASN